jgi:hypothetical protein
MTRPVAMKAASNVVDDFPIILHKNGLRQLIFVDSELYLQLNFYIKYCIKFRLKFFEEFLINLEFFRKIY